SFYGAVYDSDMTIIRSRYIGDYSNVDPSATAPLFSETFVRGVGSLIKTFDQGFDPTSFGCGFKLAGHPAAAQYGLIECRRSIQDSYGWLVILDMGNRIPASTCGNGATCPHIIAASKTYANVALRWCGLHNTQLIPGGVVSITPHALVTSGIGTGTYVTRL